MIGRLSDGTESRLPSSGNRDRERHAAGRLGRDHERLVASGWQMLSDAHGGVRDTVDVRREGLCDISDSHAHTVSYLGAEMGAAQLRPGKPWVTSRYAGVAGHQHEPLPT